MLIYNWNDPPNRLDRTRVPLPHEDYQNWPLEPWEEPINVEPALAQDDAHTAAAWAQQRLDLTKFFQFKHQLDRCDEARRQAKRQVPDIGDPLPVDFTVEIDQIASAAMLVPAPQGWPGYLVSNPTEILSLRGFIQTEVYMLRMEQGSTARRRHLFMKTANHLRELAEPYRTRRTS